MTLTDTEQQWAEALVASYQNVAEMRGEPMTSEACERLLDTIRAEWASASRYDPTADIDPDIDPGDPDPQAADRQAAIERWQQMGGRDERV